MCPNLLDKRLCYQNKNRIRNQNHERAYNKIVVLEKRRNSILLAYLPISAVFAIRFENRPHSALLVLKLAEAAECPIDEAGLTLGEHLELRGERIVGVPDVF